MEISQQSWNKSTQLIYTGVIIYSIATIITIVFNHIYIYFFDISNYMSEAVIIIFSIFSLLMNLIYIGGSIIYIVGLFNFKKILSPEDSSSVTKIFIGTLITLVIAQICNIMYRVLPLIFFDYQQYFNPIQYAQQIFIIVGFIMTLWGFLGLKDSATFPTKARKGASILFFMFILSIFRSIIFLVSINNNSIETLVSIERILAFLIGIATPVMAFIGWQIIKETKLHVPEINPYI